MRPLVSNEVTGHPVGLTPDTANAVNQADFFLICGSLFKDLVLVEEIRW